MRALHVKLFATAGIVAGLVAAGAAAQNTVSTPTVATPLPIPAQPGAPSTASAPSAPPSEAATPAVVEEPAPAAAPVVRSVAVNATDDDTPDLPPPPLKRPRFTAAVLQATDKITAETLRFEAKVGESVRYKGLIVTLRACETSAADEDLNDSIANVEVLSQPQGVAGGRPAPTRAVFHGWMFASSPSVHALEHPLYDLWVIACRTNAPVTPVAAAPAPAPTPSPKPRKPPAPKTPPVVPEETPDSTST